MVSDRAAKAAHRATESWGNKNTQWQERFDECFKYIAPERRSATKSTSRVLDEHIYDSTPLQAADSLANTYLTGLTPPWAPWALLEPGPEFLTADPQEKAQAARGLWILSQFLLTEINTRSNFFDAFQPALMDLIVSTGGLKVMSNEDNTKIIYKNIPLEQVALEENEEGLLDFVYHDVYIKGWELTQKYGPSGADEMHRGKLSGDFLKDTMSNPHQLFRFWAITEPNPRPRRDYHHCLVSQDYPSVALEDRNIQDNDYIFFRPNKQANTPYGRGRAMLVYHDIRTLNKMEELAVHGAGWAMNPMFMVETDEVMNPYTTRIVPGVKIPSLNGDMANNPPVRQVEINTNFDIGKFEIDKRRSDIKKAFFADRFSPVDTGQKMTATEVIERAKIISQEQGAATAMIEREGLSRILSLTAKKMQAQGRFPKEVSIDKSEVSVTFLSALAQARRVQEVDQMMQYQAVVERLAAIDPGAVFVADAQEMARRAAELMQIDPKLVRNDAETQEIQQEIMRGAEQMGQQPQGQPQ